LTKDFIILSKVHDLKYFKRRVSSLRSNDNPGIRPVLQKSDTSPTFWTMTYRRASPETGNRLP
jgi:hypothetical protein